MGRSTVQRRRRSRAMPFGDFMQSAGCRARPPTSGRSTRQRRNVKRSRRPPGATRRVSGRSLTSTHHPEHGEAGRGQRLIAHTRRTPCCRPWLLQQPRDMPTGEVLPSFDHRLVASFVADAWLQPPAAPELVSRGIKMPAVALITSRATPERSGITGELAPEWNGEQTAWSTTPSRPQGTYPQILGISL